jgi:hypothetical protein
MQNVMGLALVALMVYDDVFSPSQIMRIPSPPAFILWKYSMLSLGPWLDATVKLDFLFIVNTIPSVSEMHSGDSAELTAHILQIWCAELHGYNSSQLRFL